MSEIILRGRDDRLGMGLVSPKQLCLLFGAVIAPIVGWELG